MELVRIKELLESHASLQAVITELSEDDADALYAYELKHRCRPSVLDRLRARRNKLRTHREKEEARRVNNN